MTKFSHRVVQTHHPLADACGTEADNFSIKKYKKTWKIPKHPHNPLNYTKYPCENTPKCNVFFFFFKVKNVFLLYMEMEKPETQA